MKQEDEQSSADLRQHSTSSSYLVRVWREDGEVRFYLRNLRTGEERYLGDPARIGEMLAAAIGPRSGT